MRISLLLLTGILCGVFMPYQVSGGCPTKKLRYEQLGESFSVDANGDSQAKLALQGSPLPGAFTFNSSTVKSYVITFIQPTRVESVQFQIKATARATVKAYKSGSSNPDYHEAMFTGGSRYLLKGEPFLVKLDRVVRIEIIWIRYQEQQTVGIRRLFLKVCDAASCDGKLHVLSSNTVTLQPGFSAHVPSGPDLPTQRGFSDNPVAVFRGSSSRIRLRSNSEGTNFISIESTSAFKVRTFDIKTKHGKGIYVEMYSDTAGTDLLFNGTDTTTDTAWTDLQVSASDGPVNNVRRVDIHVIYDPDTSNKWVDAKKLHFWICN